MAGTIRIVQLSTTFWTWKMTQLSQPPSKDGGRKPKAIRFDSEYSLGPVTRPWGCGAAGGGWVSVLGVGGMVGRVCPPLFLQG